jgi:light-independent protochlorophyllide reductase subunit B
MIERNKKRPPVTYTTFQARDLSGDTAEIFKTAARDAVARFKPGKRFWSELPAQQS